MKKLLLFFLMAMPLVLNAQFRNPAFNHAVYHNILYKNHEHNESRFKSYDAKMNGMVPSPRNNGRFVKNYSEDYKKFWGITPYSKYAEYDENGNFVCYVVPTQQHVIKWCASRKVYGKTFISIDQVKYRGEDITYRVMYLQFEWYTPGDVLRYDLIHEKKEFIASDRFNFLRKNKLANPLKCVKVGYIGKDSKIHVLKYPAKYLYPSL